MVNLLIEFLSNTGFALAGYQNIIMILVGIVLIYLGIAKGYEPFLLIPIGFGILMGNIPVIRDFGLGIYENGSFLNYMYYGVMHDIYPRLIFLGVGALSDFSAMLARPSVMKLPQ
jgi:Na+-transporting methylmalonyl-CoA/oxaloacetate decarboxylase beta subunit